MNKNQLRTLIREEIKKVLKESSIDTFKKQHMQGTTSEDPKEIKKYFAKNKTGIYVYPGEVERGFEKATPVFYTSNLRTNITDLITDMEQQYPKYNTFTIVDIDQNGNMDVRTS